MTDTTRPFDHPGELADYLTAHSYCPGLDGTVRRALTTIGIWWAALAPTYEPTDAPTDDPRPTDR